MAGLPQPLGEETGPDLEDIPYQEPRRYPVPPRRHRLQEQIQTHVSERYRRITGVSPRIHYPSVGSSDRDSYGLGFAGFVTLFDHFRKNF